MRTEEIRRHFDAIAGDYDRWKAKASYYYQLLAELHRELVPPGASVLEVGCGTGTILAALLPVRGLGIDLSPRMIAIAAARHPELEFLAMDAAALPPAGLTLSQATLDDVFLRATGETMKEAEGDGRDEPVDPDAPVPQKEATP